MARMQTNNYDTSVLFLSQPYMIGATYTNSTGGSVTIEAGRLLGRILATNKVKPQDADSTDGSEMPVGINVEEVTVADGDTVTLQMAIAGNVDENKVVLASGETYATAVRTVSTGGGTIRDLIIRNTDIILVATTQLTGYDNQ